MKNVCTFTTLVLTFFLLCLGAQSKAQTEWSSVFDGHGVLTLEYHENGHDSWGQLTLGTPNCRGTVRGTLKDEWVESEQATYYVLTAPGGCVVRMRLGEASTATETPQCAPLHGASCSFAGTWRLRQ